MKFSWKICFSTIMLSLLIFSIGGYVLISALFQSTYEREIANAGEENRMLQYSFVAYWSAAIQDLNLSRENVRQVADAMVEGMAGSELRIRISDAMSFRLQVWSAWERISFYIWKVFGRSQSFLKSESPSTAFTGSGLWDFWWYRVFFAI